ncbi:flagellar basal body-associated FliL family protein [Roseovarius sp. SCSIO 43702]|uniref:flagellar basal body-associated FliL family protein n=1 Tax=Roseovarius sp. SCSIO 43702 TaxID=2823043 RepID=UPI001C72DF0E|nr:flagellar basal body-associated FliL family protein [Roseovarius sp. SCSIO 43702]QYX57092.1 flagellar basal body-associated FliL family protein [Roseovarius sp. SCSIO 43702]
MKKILILVLLPLLGLGGGVEAGLALRSDAPPDAETPPETCQPADHAANDVALAETHAAAPAGRDYVKLNNQFVVPLVAEGGMQGLIVMSLNLEVTAGSSEAVYLHEPKLRDHFLEVLFEHAGIGGFDGDFTDSRKLGALKAALRDVARKVLGPVVQDVLITDLARQAG